VIKLNLDLPPNEFEAFCKEHNDMPYMVYHVDPTGVYVTAAWLCESMDEVRVLQDILADQPGTLQCGSKGDS
jgi:hypothetical protein